MSAPRLDAFDGLRGIAIGLVLWYHLWQVSWLDPHITAGAFNLPLISLPVSGFLGVELFFFISAFCLSYPYVRASFAGRSLPSLRRFIYRRFIKIVPSYVLCLAVILALAAVPPLHDSFGENIHWNGPWSALTDIGAHLAFLHTYWFDSYSSINGVFWTLGIEVQFYVLFPFLMAIMLRAPIPLVAVMTATGIAYRTIVSACCRGPIFDHNIDQLLGFLDYFAAGMLCAYLYEWIRHRRPQLAGRRWLWTLLAAASLIWILAMFYHLEKLRWTDHFAEWWVVRNATFYAASLLCLALGSLFAFPAWHRVLANPVLVFLSLISYNLYLWHQVLARWVATLPFPHATANPRQDPAWQWFAMLAGVAATVGVATLITFVFERPLLRMDPAPVTARIKALLRRFPGRTAADPVEASQP